MTGRKCARCGREQPSWDGNGAFAPTTDGHVGDHQDDSLSTLLRAAWTTINGEDICPDCQIGAERQELPPQIISAIESEVARSAEFDPSHVEPGLVTFAMQIREALASYEESQKAELRQAEPKGGSEVLHEVPKSSMEPREDGPVDATMPPSRTHLDVAVTGAFLTGCPLRIGIDNYEDVQQALAAKLIENVDHGWLTRPSELREGSYDSGGGFSKEVPLVLACRGGVKTLARAQEILGDRSKREHDWLESQGKGWKIRPTSMRIEVYDVGVAVINGTFDVDVPAKVTLDDIARRLKRMVWLRPAGELSSVGDQPDRAHEAAKVKSPITEMFKELSKETRDQFHASVDATPSAKKLDPWLPKSDADGLTSTEWGRLLWLHPVHMLKRKDADTQSSSARALAPTFSKTIEVPRGRFVSGVGWSAIVTREKSARALPLRLIHLHWAYFALYMEIDRGLLTVLDKRSAATKGTTLTELETDAGAVFKDYLRVMKARARVDSALASLGGDEQAIWDVIADVQKFEPLVRGVDRKVEVLQKIADRRVQQATTASSRRSTRILGTLTTLTLVTLATTLLVYFFGGFSDSVDDHHWYYRVGFLVAGSVVAIALWFVTFLPHPRRSWNSWKARRAEPDDEP